MGASRRGVEFYIRRGDDRWLLTESPEDIRLRLYQSIADVMVRRYYLRQKDPS